MEEVLANTTALRKAMCCGPKRFLSPSGVPRLLINIYSPKGDPIRTVVVPVGRLGQFDFDGNRLAVSSSERTFVYSADGTLLSWASHRDFSGKSLFIHPKLLKDGTELVLIDRNNPLEIRRYR